MPGIAYLVTFALGASAFVLAFWFPLFAWIPLFVPELYLLRVFSTLRTLEVRTIPEVSARANELLAKHPGYYWQPWAGRDCRQAASLAGLLGLAIGIVGVVKGSWTSLGLALVNLAAMMVMAPRFDPSGYLTPEYAAAHDELVAHLSQKPRTVP